MNPSSNIHRFQIDPEKLLIARLNAPKNSSTALKQKVLDGLAARSAKGYSMSK